MCYFTEVIYIFSIFSFYTILTGIYHKHNKNTYISDPTKQSTRTRIAGGEMLSEIPFCGEMVERNSIFRNTEKLHPTQQAKAHKFKTICHLTDGLKKKSAMILPSFRFGACGENNKF